MELEPTVHDTLTQRHLLPGIPPPEVLAAWPAGTVEATYARGCLLAGAVGDALGRPAETKRPSVIAERYGRIRDFMPWWGWKSGPIGTFTDDTQLTLWTAESLLADDAAHQELFAATLAEHRSDIRGIGFATDDAIDRLQQGVPWHQSGSRSAGNGAAMRAAPIGIACGHDLAALRQVAALNAVVTHADPLAVASTIVQASAVAYLLVTPPGSLEPRRFLDWLVAGAADLHDPGHRERRDGTDDTLVRLVDRIAELGPMLGLEPRQAFAHTYNGAFVLESLPAAIWSFLHHPEDLEEAICTAVAGGYDADTVAAMCGNLAGAYLGEAAIPQRWLDELEDADHIASLAENLLALRR
ncbi:MAG: ADP-ribosylglycohydrolase family protein [Acidimicrobiales bacterium]